MELYAEYDLGSETGTFAVSLQPTLAKLQKTAQIQTDYPRIMEPTPIRYFATTANKCAQALADAIDWEPYFQTEKNYSILQNILERFDGLATDHDDLVKALFATLELYQLDLTAPLFSYFELEIYTDQNDAIDQWIINRQLPKGIKPYLNHSKVLDNIGQYRQTLPDNRLIIDTSTAK